MPPYTVRLDDLLTLVASKGEHGFLVSAEIVLLIEDFQHIFFSSEGFSSSCILSFSILYFHHVLDHGLPLRLPFCTILLSVAQVFIA
jgi:hypothetical protein